MLISWKNVLAKGELVAGDIALFSWQLP